MQLIALATAAGLLASAVTAHPEVLPRNEIERRGMMSKRCEASAAAFNKKRYAKRQAAKRAAMIEFEEAEALAKRGVNQSTYVNDETPYYDAIQNNTCVLAPEVTWGPYVWPRSQILREDMSEGQPGVPLTLDIGVLDMATCEPLPDVIVNMWHCNATGYYSSFTGRDPNTKFVDLVESTGITMDDYRVGVTDLHTDDTTFLRGMYPTNDAGMMEMKTTFPGFYIERSIHIHVQVYNNWTVFDNGTISSGDIVSSGQLYFDEDVATKIMALSPYAEHTEIQRTTLDQDYVLKDSQVGGYNPIVSIVAEDGENIENGMIGYITIGVDTTAIETQSLDVLDQPYPDAA